MPMRIKFMQENHLFATLSKSEFSREKRIVFRFNGLRIWIFQIAVRIFCFQSENLEKSDFPEVNSEDSQSPKEQNRDSYYVSSPARLGQDIEGITSIS